ncbi:MAG: VCBS repeat-containing protein [Armatimonadetes bacterium]|nr:VCBS repeat-containing protein [Armatimonadota bacterium]
MRTDVHLRWAALAAALCLGVGRAADTPPTPFAPPTAEQGFAKPYLWLYGGWVAPPRTPLLADVNGDGYADFVYATPNERLIDVSLNGRGWKPMRGKRLLSDLPEAICSMCGGRLGGKTCDLAVLGARGGLLKALSDDKGHYPQTTSLATLPELAGRAWLFAGKVVSSDLDDLIVVDSEGRVVVLDAAGKVFGRGELRTPVAAAAAGDLDGDGKTELVIRTRARVAAYHLAGAGPERSVVLPAPAGRDALAVGDVNADGKADILSGGQVLLAPDFRQALPIPGWETIKEPVTAMLADVAGHGRADVVLQHLGKEYYGSFEADCDLYIAWQRGDPDWDCDGLSNEEEAKTGSDPLDRCTSHDGLLDGWKVHGFWGVDFPGMGASPLHKDVFVQNLPFDTVPIDEMEKYQREHIAPFFADLPYTNVDGTKGFAIHAITLSPAWSEKDHKGRSWQSIADETFPPDRFGLYHWMLVTGMGGGGQSYQLADAGSCNMRAWVHEFGHQLGLSHSGKWPTWSPTYRSLMNYSGGGKFSTGELADVVLNESHLPGKLPWPLAKVEFLSKPPYSFHLQEAGPDATLVDWGWTGQFTDGPVQANISYGYSLSGRRHSRLSAGFRGTYECFTDYSPELADHLGVLYLLVNERHEKLKFEDPRTEPPVLTLRRYLEREVWGKPVELATDATGDPCALSNGKEFYVFYPTAEGVAYRWGAPGRLSTPRLIPYTQGAYVRAASFHGLVWLFLYYGEDKTIRYRSVDGDQLGSDHDLGILSTIPPGAATDTIHDQLLLSTAGLQGKWKYRWQVQRCDWDAATAGFKPHATEWVGGDKVEWRGNLRTLLIFDARPEMGKDGRIYYIGRGENAKPDDAGCFFTAKTVSYKDFNDGWMLNLVYDEWSQSRRSVAACWHADNYVRAYAAGSGSADSDGAIHVDYNGLGIGHVDMGDFDDISLMANYGIARSITTFARMPPPRKGANP